MRERQHKIAIGALPIVYVGAVTAILLSVFLLLFVGITEQLELYIITDSLKEHFADRDFECHGAQIFGLLEGHRAELEFSVKRKYVGVSENRASVRIYDQAGEDITYKYKPLYYFGTVEVVPAEYRIKTGSASAQYSGKELSSPLCEISHLIEGHTATVHSHAVLKDVGRIPNIPRLSIYDREGKDITDQYVPVTDYGALEVLPREITVSSADHSLSFSGDPFLPREYRLEKGALAQGEELKVDFPLQFTQKGSYTNYFTLSVLRTEGEETVDVTDNYILELNYGTVRIE